MCRQVQQYAHNNLAGCVTTRKSRETGSTVSVYHATQAGYDPDGGDWVTVCETHSTLCNHATQALALYFLPFPSNWCEECQQIRLTK